MPTRIGLDFGKNMSRNIFSRSAEKCSLKLKDRSFLI